MMMSFEVKTKMRSLTIVLALLLTGGAGLAADERVPELAPLCPAHEGMTGDQLFAKLLESNRDRDARLRQYSAVRTYKVSNDRGKIYAQEVVRVDYEAP